MLEVENARPLHPWSQHWRCRGESIFLTRKVRFDADNASGEEGVDSAMLVKGDEEEEDAGWLGLWKTVSRSLA